MKNTKKPDKNDKNIINRTGRPPISPERVTKLEQGFKNGLNVTESCLFAGVARQTYYRNVKENEEFSDKMEYSQHIVLIRAKQNITAKIIEGDIELSKWLIERKDRDFRLNNTEVNVVQEQTVSESKASEELNKRSIAQLNKGTRVVRYWQRKYDEALKEENAK